MAKSIFTKQSLEKVNSPEQLNDYIKTSSPGAWMIIAAAIILLISVLIWGAMGSLDTTVEAKGIANGENIICYISDASDIAPGNKVSIGDISGEVISVSEKPISSLSVKEELNTDEYTLYCLDLSEWNYIIKISAPGYKNDGFVTANITTESVKPISFIFD